MKSRSNKFLSSSVRAALGITASIAVAMPSVVLAQDEEAGLEEVLVTGSRIKQADLDNANPVTVVSREDIQLTGMTDIGDLIQRLPSMSGSPIGTTTNNGGNGSVTIDLRGIGAGRTLNLVNGMRSVDGGDYQAIPSNIIERIEILKDGAAAVYGADAVAGVVNIITRTDFEGVEVELLQADGFDMDDGMQQGFSFLAGKAWDDGHIVFGAEYVDQKPAYQSDAPWGFFQDSYYIYPAGCESQITAPFDGTPSGGCYPSGSSRIPESRLAFGSYGPTSSRFGANRVGTALGTYMNQGNGLESYDGRTYNYAPVNYIQTPYERTNLYLAGHFDINETTKFSAEVRGNFRESAQELAPQPYNSPTDPAYQGIYNPELITGSDLDGNGEIGTFTRFDPNTGAFLTGANDTSAANLKYSGIHPDNYYLQQALIAAGRQDLLGLPVIDARRRMVETTRRFTQDVNQVQANFQLDGSFGEIDWSAYYNMGRRQSDDNDYGQFYGPFLANAMGPSADLNGDGTPECYADVTDSDSLIAGCVPFNFFGGPGSVTQEMLNYVGVNLIDTFESELDQGGFSFTGSWMDLAGGPLGWAAGYDYRKESLTYSPDSGKQAGEVTGNKGKGTSGSYKVDSLYFELLAPVMDNMELSLGYRYDDFSTYGSGDVWKLGFRWEVTDDIAVRATWGEVFKAPDIYDLYQGEVDSFPTAVDPCSDRNPDPAPAACAQEVVQLDSQLLAKVGGNQNLDAEQGDTLTAGIVWQPTFGDLEMAFTLDYWSVELEDGITSLGVQFILNDCYVRGNAGSCGLINRRSDYTIEFVQDAPINASRIEIAGIDAGIDATYSMGDMGTLSGSVLWTHNTKHDRQSFEGDSVSDLIGRYAGATFAEDKANITASWNRGNMSVAYLGEYIGELESGVTFINYDQKVDSQMYHDLVFGYMFEDTSTSVTFGVTNFTDEEPPYIDAGFNASTDPSTYRLFGRSYYLRILQSF
jgi:outer membrane receptor protein involved in Fe transport